MRVKAYILKVQLETQNSDSHLVVRAIFEPVRDRNTGSSIKPTPPANQLTDRRLIGVGLYTLIKREAHTCMRK